jgi:hypothetical protein
MSQTVWGKASIIQQRLSSLGLRSTSTDNITKVAIIAG